MKLRLISIAIFSATTLLVSCKEQKTQHSDLIIGAGKMPSLASDAAGKFYVVYGTGDSIMYATSTDKGQSFSSPAVVANLPELVAGSMRGPQIATTTEGLVIIAANKLGDIFSFTQTIAGKWLPPVKVNDIDAVAKEGLIALAADNNNAFAVWLDLRDKHNKMVGAKSTDGGKTWSKNLLVYASPDTTVCECCKPSVAINGASVFVMFRNQLQGNRDLYLIQSTDGGTSFGEARQLGNEHWALKGCPMDGGGLALNSKGVPQTIWRRNNSLYACTPGQPEKAVGEGKGCSLASVDDKNVYAWTENGDIIVSQPQGIKHNLGKGQLPHIKAINNEQVLCVWENDRKVHAGIVNL